MDGGDLAKVEKFDNDRQDVVNVEIHSALFGAILEDFGGLGGFRKMRNDSKRIPRYATIRPNLEIFRKIWQDLARFADANSRRGLV